MAQLGFVGEKIDLLIKQGSTFGPYHVELTNPDLTPVNLTGAVIRSKIKKAQTDVTEVEQLNIVVTDAPNGKFSFGLTDAETALMVAGSSIKDPLSLYKWDMELQDSIGNVIPLYYGDCRVFGEITK